MVTWLMFKRLTHFVLSVICILAFLPQAASAAPVIPNPPPPITGTVTIWHIFPPGSSWETAFLQVIANALADNPGLTIIATYVPEGTILSDYQTAVAGGGGPDLLESGGSLGILVRNNLIQNLSTALVGRLDHVYPHAVESFTYEGQLYGVPLSAKTAALLYKKSAIPVPPTTTAELQALVEGGKKLFIANGVAGGAYYNFGFFMGFGGDLLDEENRCIADRAGFKPAMKYLVALRDSGATVFSSWGDVGSLFHNGEIDMLIDGPWSLPYYEGGLGADLGAVPLPAGPVGPSSAINGPDGFFVNPNTTVFTSAVELALYMTSQASSQIFADVGRLIPVRDDVSTDPLISAFVQAAVQGFTSPEVEEFNNFWAPFNEMMTDVLAGTITWQMGVQRACDAMNELNGFDVYKNYLPVLKR